ncbi:hypothetical protein VPHK373_0086 [Vibrio phage K373]
MKTFETEKHNIPKGATHYSNENDENYFLWCKVDIYGQVWGIVNDESLLATVEKIQKPRTNTEFVKVEFEHAWEAVKEFEDGEKLYTKRSHKDFVLIDNAPDVLRFLYNLHRKVETEIDERQEFIDECQKYGSWEAMYDSGKFKLVDK